VDEKIGEETYLQRIFTEQKQNNNQKMPKIFKKLFQQTLTNTNHPSTGKLRYRGKQLDCHLRRFFAVILAIVDSR
jgi:hypothetical protein